MTSTTAPATATPELLEVVNPATGEHVATVACTAGDEVSAIADRAREAQASWGRTPWRERARVLRRFHDLLFERADEVLDTIQSETGKSRRDALSELISVAGTARYFLAHGRRQLATRRARGALPWVTSACEVLHPRGLVGLITPWNFPFLLGIGDALPALAAGNAVLLKPSELTPRSALLARDLLLEAGLDPELLHVLVGTGAELGAPLIDAVDYIGFTGSLATGRLVAQRAAARPIPCSLELGGKNPMLVLRGANVDQAVAGLLLGSFANAGQTCIGIERVYVHAELWDDFVTAAATATASLRQGWSTGWDVNLGSLASNDHAERVRDHLRDAIERGATVVAGGLDVPEGLPETFVAPTLLTDTSDGMQLQREETFGPVVRLERVASEAEAIQRANDSEYGLNASVWAGSRRAGRHVARQLVAGSVGVNSTLLIYGSFDVPMGGTRASGIGARHGAQGMRRFCRSQSIVSSFPQRGGYEGLLGLADSPRGALLLLRAMRTLRRIPGAR
ncbi:MAG: succinate-semialdehyde dehydrogenase [Thermoleophilia bacterium]|nr:succinate-semialdehyde dehydrogenase [Thermoleophilia bacterium]